MSHDLNRELAAHAESFDCSYCDATKGQKCWSKRARINDEVGPHVSRLMNTMTETGHFACSYCRLYHILNGVVRCSYKDQLHVCCPRCRGLFGANVGKFKMRRCAEQLAEEDQALLALAGMGA